MNKVIFQIMGGFVLFSAAGLLLVSIGVAVGYAPRLSSSTVSPVTFWVRLIFAVGLQILVGIGLLKLRKWAALAFSVAALYPAFWSAVYAIHPLRPAVGEANWLGYIYALLLIIPLVITVKYWHILVWRQNTK